MLVYLWVEKLIVALNIKLRIGVEELELVKSSLGARQDYRGSI